MCPLWKGLFIIFPQCLLKNTIKQSLENKHQPFLHECQVDCHLQNDSTPFQPLCQSLPEATYRCYITKRRENLLLWNSTGYLNHKICHSLIYSPIVRLWKQFICFLPNTGIYPHAVAILPDLKSIKAVTFLFHKIVVYVFFSTCLPP